jgi:3-oxoacyl-[acyl-carrier protein] reductase
MLKIDLSGRRALVCGASGGIGAETARSLAGAGARVVLLARSEDKLKSLLSELPGSGHQALTLDLVNVDSIARTLGPLGLEDDPISILICNAGGPKAGPLLEAQVTEMNQAFAVHVLANQALAKVVVPGMRALKYGRIINVISTSVKIPIPNLGVSNTIRAAVASWAKTLANELGPDGITVNNVLPGYTNTDRLQNLAENAAKRSGQTESEIREAWRKTIPAARFAEPHETAAAIAFLASPLASYINGVNLPVDGGRTGCL